MESTPFVLIEEFFSLTLYGYPRTPVAWRLMSPKRECPKNGAGPSSSWKAREGLHSSLSQWGLSGVRLLSSAIKTTTWVRTALLRASRCAPCSSSRTCTPSSAPPPACGAATSRAPSASTQVGRCEPGGTQAAGTVRGRWSHALGCMRTIGGLLRNCLSLSPIDLCLCPAQRSSVTPYPTTTYGACLSL